jgi:hypothetical protein
MGAADSLGRLPRECFIGIDHFLIGEGGSTEWESLYPYHHYLIEKLNRDSGNHFVDEVPELNRRIFSLFSLNYFKASLEFLTKGNSKKYFDVAQRTPGIYGRFSDGTVCYPYKYTHPDPVQQAIDARGTGQKTGIPPADPVRFKLFTALVDHLQAHGVAIRFVMIPYHPEFYKASREHQQALFQEEEAFFRSVAEKRHIPVTGAFDADALGMPQADFYDTYHCSRAAIKKYVFNQ